jgi:hypothetical protein
LDCEVLYYDCPGDCFERRQRKFTNSQHGDPGCSVWDIVINQDEGVACCTYEFYREGAQRRFGNDNDDDDVVTDGVRIVK